MKRKTGIKLRMRTKLKHSVVVLSFFFLSVTVGLMLYFNFTQNKSALGAVNNEYRSITSGNWSTLSTWQRYNGSSWVAATAVPTSAHKLITVQSGHTVTVTANVTVDEVVVSSGGTLSLNTGITLTVANGSGTDFSVSGTFRNAGTVTINSSATIAYQASGTYQHNYSTTAGVIPTASWATGSSCEIVGYTTNSSTPTGMQSFYNFVWNCPSQSSAITLNGTLTSVNGNFSIVSTGSSELRVATNASTLSVGGDFIQTGGNLTLSTASGITSTINVAGDFSLEGGTFSVVNGSNSTGKINLSGNYSHTGGTLLVGGNASTLAQVIFKKSGSQNFVSSGNNILSNVDFIVNSGSVLVMGTNVCYGRNFTLSNGGGIDIGMSDGISLSSATGNVQSSGTRTFNTGSDYTFSGSVAQVCGDGMPATVRNLKINNPGDLTLPGSVTVSGTLTFINGRIVTGSNTLHVSNTSTSSVVGNSNASYVIGNLRRSVLPTGNYEFPIGTPEYYELISSNLVVALGFSSILATFTQTDPLLPAFPLSGIRSNNVEIDSMLNYGYWTLAPNSPITAGVHTVSLSEQGYTNAVGAKTQFFALTRASISAPWQLPGLNVLAGLPLTGGIATGITSGLLSFNQYAIGYGSILAFTNPTLLSGSAGQVGAIYKFPNVCSNVDAWIEITQLAGGATLSSIDNNSSGYNEAFQPFIDIPRNSTASIQWNIRFKVAGTSTDTVLAKVQLTGVDVDGGSGIREFVEATMPTSYSLGSPTILTVTNNGGSYRAVSNYTTVSNIDTTAKQAMYQMNYYNVNSFFYRTGAISTNSSSEVRQTSLYFASFLTGTIALPVTLTSFKATLRERKVVLEWSTASEIENDYFNIERSKDANTFEAIGMKRGMGNSTVVNNYSYADESPLQGYSYYRLKQTDYDGKYTYSPVVSVKNGKVALISNLEIQSVSPNPFYDKFNLVYTLPAEESASFMLVSVSGKILEHRILESHEGINRVEFENKSSLDPGMYFAVITTKEQRVVKKIYKEH